MNTEIAAIVRDIEKIMQFIERYEPLLESLLQQAIDANNAPPSPKKGSKANAS